MLCGELITYLNISGVGETSAKGHLNIESIIDKPFKFYELKILLAIDGLNFKSHLLSPWEGQLA